MGAGQPVGTVRRPLFHSLRAGTLLRAGGRAGSRVPFWSAIRDHDESGNERGKLGATPPPNALVSLAEQLGPMAQAQRLIAADLADLTHRGEMRRQDVLAVNACAIP